MYNIKCSIELLVYLNYNFKYKWNLYSLLKKYLLKEPHET